MKLKGAALAVIGMITIAYPFVVYSSLKHIGPAVLSMALLVLLIIRVVIRRDFKQPEQRWQLLIVGSLCIAAAVFTSPTLLRYYPVAMSLSFALFFVTSLYGERTLVERFARIFTNDFEPYQMVYMRRLTVVWAVVLLANALVAAYTACCSSLATWTLYNGALAYGLMAGFMLLELVFRQFYKQRHAAQQRQQEQA